MAEAQTKSESRRKIMVAVDGSEHSDRAFDFYAKAMMRAGDEVLLLHAFEVPPLPYSSGPFVFAYYEEWSQMVKENRQACEMILRQYEEKVKKFKEYRDKQLHYQVLLVVGKPAGNVVCQVAKEENADIIVTGSRGVGAIRRTFLGSVSDHVVHHAGIPVCVCPEPVKPEAEQHSKPA